MLYDTQRPRLWNLTGGQGRPGHDDDLMTCRRHPDDVPADGIHWGAWWSLPEPCDPDSIHLCPPDVDRAARQLLISAAVKESLRERHSANGKLGGRPRGRAACSICGAPSKARKLCQKHYSAWQRDQARAV